MTRIVLPNDVLLPQVGELLAEGKVVTMAVKGVSMLPFIVGGRDSVTLVRPDVLKTGDIALAQIRKGYFVLHRIISIEGDIVTLMGDGNVRGCEKCRKKDVMGIAVRILKNGKETDCRSRMHLLNARLWRLLLPVRRYLLAVYRRVFL
ncbi:MAG: S24/S26 family peptidase [Bacteroidales bacterium]|nr:S24/S26 family peptidase [Bacteroidales bacterium]